MPVRDALSVYHHVERHAVRVAASPEEALRAAREVRLGDVPAVRLLLRLRGLGGARGAALWDALQAAGFRPFGQDTLVLVARPWALRQGQRPVGDFLNFAEPGWAKLAIDFRANPEGEQSRLLTETRVYLTDGAARRRFRLYWLVVRPFSGFLRRRWLAAAKRRAEAG